MNLGDELRKIHEESVEERKKDFYGALPDELRKAAVGNKGKMYASYDFIMVGTTTEEFCTWLTENGIRYSVDNDGVVVWFC